MIRITVELISARTKQVTHLGTAYIANDGSGTPVMGDYEAVFSQRGEPNRIWKQSRVENFPRKRLLMWDLLYRALRPICKDRK